jgi:hypothetical protein
MTLPPGPGPFVLVHRKMLGKIYTFMQCRCPECSEARRAIPRAQRAIRRAKAALRAHHRRRSSAASKPAKVALTPQERAARILAKYDGRTPCPRCGKLPGGHRSCGVAGGDRAGHGRRVATAKLLLTRARRRIAAEAAAAASATALPVPPTATSAKEEPTP